MWNSQNLRKNEQEQYVATVIVALVLEAVLLSFSIAYQPWTFEYFLILVHLLLAASVSGLCVSAMTCKSIPQKCSTTSSTAWGLSSNQALPVLPCRFPRHPAGAFPVTPVRATTSPVLAVDNTFSCLEAFAFRVIFFFPILTRSQCCEYSLPN